MPPTARLKNSRVARLMNMSVLPEYRRRGAARRLLKSIADYAAAYGSEKIMLNASPMGELLYAFFRFERISGGYEFFPPPTPDRRIFFTARHHLCRSALQLAAFKSRAGHRANSSVSRKNR